MGELRSLNCLSCVFTSASYKIILFKKVNSRKKKKKLTKNKDTNTETVPQNVQVVKKNHIYILSAYMCHKTKEKVLVERRKDVLNSFFFFFLI